MRVSEELRQIHLLMVQNNAKEQVNSALELGERATALRKKQGDLIKVKRH